LISPVMKKPRLGRQGCQPFGLAFVLHRLAARGGLEAHHETMSAIIPKMVG
jgi:hypothetical protein